MAWRRLSKQYLWLAAVIVHLLTSSSFAHAGPAGPCIPSAPSLSVEYGEQVYSPGYDGHDLRSPSVQIADSKRATELKCTDHCLSCSACPTCGGYALFTLFEVPEPDRQTLSFGFQSPYQDFLSPADRRPPRQPDLYA